MEITLLGKTIGFFDLETNRFIPNKKYIEKSEFLDNTNCNNPALIGYTLHYVNEAEFNWPIYTKIKKNIFIVESGISSAYRKREYQIKKAAAGA